MQIHGDYRIYIEDYCGLVTSINANFNVFYAFMHILAMCGVLIMQVDNQEAAIMTLRIVT